YVHAVGLTAATGGTGARAAPEPALALYLAPAHPLMVLPGPLGPSSALTTEASLRRLDMTRIYAEAYEQAADGTSAGARAAAAREADTEFGTDTGTDGTDGTDGGGA